MLPTLNLRPFQIVLLSIFGGLFILGIIFLSLFRGLYTETLPYGESVVVWGTLDRGAVQAVMSEIRDIDKDFNVVEYVQKDPRTFDSELLNAIAEERSPDLIIIPHKSLVMYRGKLLPISFETIRERDFRDTYIDGAEIFMLSDGVYGIPAIVDPLVMYWNRDIFSTAGLALPPTTWEELVYTVTPSVTRKNSNLDIFQSTVAFGEYQNVTHAKDILSMLMLQSGSTLVDETTRGYEITFQNSGTGKTLPAEAALSFYTQFALPSNLNYTWNRALPYDKSQFLAGELALYFGKGSEYAEINTKNPNLNFDTAPVPQEAGASTYRNYGDFYAFAIPKTGNNILGAYNAASMFTSKASSQLLAEKLDMVSARRDVIAEGASGSHQQVLYSSALVSRGWLDPNPIATESIFKQMIEDVTSSRQKVSRAVSDTLVRFRLLFQ